MIAYSKRTEQVFVLKRRYAILRTFRIATPEVGWPTIHIEDFVSDVFSIILFSVLNFL